MAFVLKVTAGGGKGTEYSFDDGQEAKLGRTADNDVVVKDAAASRSHARIFHKGAKFFVEDLGSANGTKVNNAQINGTKELRRGDNVVIGDVVLSFLTDGGPPGSTMDEESLVDEPEEAQSEAEPLDDQDEAQDPNATMERSDRAALARRPPPARRPARGRPTPAPEPDEAESEEPEPEPSEPSSVENEVPDYGTPADEPESTRAVVVRAPKAMTKANERALKSGRSKPAVVVEGHENMSAADRARMRRQMQQSSSGRLQLMWDELPKLARAGLLGFMGLMVLGSVGLVAWALANHGPKNKVEPLELQPNGQTISDSFGLGEDVTFRTPDQKTFTFTTASPTRVVGVLHYQARNVATDEVTISLNGADLGTIPPDAMDSSTRELDLVLPALQLRKSDEENTLSFDNSNNPPGKDEWMVWNIWVEINPVPEMSAEEAERRAQQQIERAGVLNERRDIGAENLFLAWKTYRDAWLLLEATPNHNVELDSIARTRMRELRPQLDKKCNKLLAGVQSALNQTHEDIDNARAILEDVPRYFPTREHPCLGLSQSMLRDLEPMDELEHAGNQ